jgi:hypothetical protein
LRPNTDRLEQDAFTTTSRNDDGLPPLVDPVPLAFGPPPKHGNVEDLHAIATYDEIDSLEAFRERKERHVKDLEARLANLEKNSGRLRLQKAVTENEILKITSANPRGAFTEAGNESSQPSNFPPVNPADQNPPCKTLYVGNLPLDTSEDEVQKVFSKQPGFKRLCFRTKQHGPMCFVEFEDVSFATKALNDLYGYTLQNGINGGIRLSFSKNPLGVRSGPGITSSGPSEPAIFPANEQEGDEATTQTLEESQWSKPKFCVEPLGFSRYARIYDSVERSPYEEGDAYYEAEPAYYDEDRAYYDYGSSSGTYVVPKESAKNSDYQRHSREDDKRKSPYESQYGSPIKNSPVKGTSADHMSLEAALNQEREEVTKLLEGVNQGSYLSTSKATNTESGHLPSIRHRIMRNVKEDHKTKARVQFDETTITSENPDFRGQAVKLSHSYRKSKHEQNAAYSEFLNKKPRPTLKSSWANSNLDLPPRRSYAREDPKGNYSNIENTSKEASLHPNKDNPVMVQHKAQTLAPKTRPTASTLQELVVKAEIAPVCRLLEENFEDVSHYL